MRFFVRLLALACALAAANYGLPAAGNSPPRTVFNYQLAGSGNYPSAFAVDAHGGMYVVGSRFAPSGPFPISDNAAIKSERSLFVAKIEAGGEKLVWATYLGGTKNRNSYWRGATERAAAIAVDPEGNVFVVGMTANNDFPTTSGALLEEPLGSSSDGFLTKISADGSRLIYSTYLGVANPRSVAVDPSGNAYVVLNADAGLPYERRDLSSVRGAGASVIAKVNPAGGIVYATRFGNRTTTATTLALDGTGGLCVGGQTDVNGFTTVNPTTSSCWVRPDGGCSNPFVARFDPSGSQILFSTMLGGTTQASSLTSLSLDPAGSILAAGTTSATDFPTRNAYQQKLAGGTDYFISRFLLDGTLASSTYVGSEMNDAIPTVSADFSGRLFLLGATSSRTGVVPGMQHPDVPLYVSHDDGTTWAPSAIGLKTTVYTIAVSALDRTWYAGTPEGVYRSSDGGTTWSEPGPGIQPDYMGARNVYQLAVDPAHAGVVYAGSPTGAFKSEDRGATWVQIDAEPIYLVLGFQAQVVVDGNGWVYLGTLGVRRSENRGASWIDLSENGLATGPTGRKEDVRSIVFDPTKAGTIYILQNEIALRTTDAGRTWVRMRWLAPNENSFYGIAASANLPGRLFASGWNRMFRSDDGGQNWSPLAPIFYRAKFWLDDRRPGTVFAIDSWTGTPSMVSRDDGETWNSLTLPETIARSGLVLDAVQPATLFAPASVNVRPLLVQFDQSARSVQYAAFLEQSIPAAVVVDPSGAIYALMSSTSSFGVTKLTLP